VRQEGICNFNVRYQSRLDDTEIASGLAKAILTLPKAFFPLKCSFDDGTRPVTLFPEEWNKLTSMMATPVHEGLTRWGGVLVESKRFAEMYFFVQWNHPQLAGLNGIVGDFPVYLDSAGLLIDDFRDWISRLSQQHGTVWGHAESRKDMESKLDMHFIGPDSEEHSVREFFPPKCLPDILWLNIFGQPYVELIGRDKLLSTPADVVRELPGGAVAITVSPSPFRRDEEEYDERCRRIKEHIGRQFFFDVSDPHRQCPQPKVDVEYLNVEAVPAPHLKRLRARLEITESAALTVEGDRIWLDGLRDWVERNPTYSDDFAREVRVNGIVLDYSVESLKVVDKFFLKHRKKNDEMDPQLLLQGAAYLAQVLLRNASPPGSARLRIDTKLNNAVVDLPNGMVAAPMARISNLWHLGKEESTHFYAEVLLSKEKIGS